MKIALPLLCLALIGSASAAEPAVRFDWFEYTGRDTVFEAPLPAGHFRNPILAGFYPDPSICRVGDDYYLINSTFAYFPGIPIFHSRDLVSWSQIGHVIDRAGQLDYDGLGVSRAIFAPDISYHDGTFYVVCTMVDAGGNFLVTAKNPAGPWSDPVWFNFEGIDPSLFFDDDGRAWMLNNGAPEGKPLYEGHRAIWIQEFDVAAKKLIGPRSVLVNGGVDLSKKPVWIEGPHIYRREGLYYLCAAEGGTGDNHSQVILRSKSVTGPYEPWEKNPILTQRDLDGTVPQAVTTTGHADLVIGPDGNWWSVFLGCRPFAGKFYATGRETFLLPVTWTQDGWPQILPPGERVPYNGLMPGSKNSLDVGIPLTGNFTWRDDFSTAALSPLWVMLRQPHETWWRQTGDHLYLTASKEALSGNGQPSFLARRLQHARFDASVAFIAPTEQNVSAGIALFQSEKYHYYFAIKRTSVGLELFVEKLNGKKPEIVATLKIAATDQLKLRITGEDKVLSFSYAISIGDWQTLVADADATVVTTQASGGFVGAVVGMHVRNEPQ